MKKFLTQVACFLIVIYFISPLQLFAQSANGSSDSYIPGTPNPYPNPCVNITHDLDVGSTDVQTNGDVSKLQFFLSGFKRRDVTPLSKTDITGTFNGKTQAALKVYQAKNKLNGNGKADSDTRKIMRKDCESFTPGEPSFIQPKLASVNTSFLGYVSNILHFLNPKVLLGQAMQAIEFVVNGGNAGGAAQSQSVTNFTLVNADSGQDIMVLSNNVSLDLASLPSRNLNIRANTSPSPVTDRIRFGYDSNSNYVTDQNLPYTLAGDAGATKYYAWTPTLGTHKITATPFNKGKSSGSTLSLSFTVTNSTPVTDTISPTVSISAPSDGQNISGAVAISVSASDNVGVSKVELYKDGVLLSTDIASPYNFNWTAPSATSTDQSFSFVAKAYDLAGNVGVSNPVNLTVLATAPIPPVVPPSPISVRINNLGSFNELYISGSSGNDNISVSQSGSTIVVLANGGSDSFSGPFGDIVIKGEDGDDIISVDSSVSTKVMVYGGNGNNNITASGNAKVVVVTISGGVDTISGNGNTSYWVGKEDVVHATSGEINAKRVHSVASFYQPWTTSPTDPAYVPITLNSPNIKDPTDSGTFSVTGRSLFGQGPVESDINQGSVGDCWLDASLAAIAHSMPDYLQETGADLGDGTYVVQFMNGTTPVFVRVDSDFAAGSWGGFNFNHPGYSSNIWGVVYEKAFAYFRKSQNTYSSLAGGWMNEAYNDLGIPNTSLLFGGSSSFYSTDSTGLNSGKPITFGSIVSPTNVVGNHGYTQTGVSIDSSGNASYTERNPWGMSGTSYEDSNGYVTLTYPQMTTNYLQGVIKQ